MSPRRAAASLTAQEDNVELAEIAALVHACAGLVIDAARRDVFTALVHDRSAQLGLPHRAAYLTRLRLDVKERQILVEGLTIGETYFARIPPQIRALQELVLPAILARGGRQIRIWSAGCSTGEEPYTVALLLAKLLPAGVRGSDISVIATDVNSQALAAAREGRYRKRSVALLSDDDLQRYFVPDAGGWRVGEELRTRVEFRQHNLAADPPPADRLDLILCRNVLIYFDRPKMHQVIDEMHGALQPGGWLLLGHSETLWRLHTGFGLVRHDDAFLYRRAPAADRPLAPLPARRSPPKAWQSPTLSASLRPPSLRASSSAQEAIREALAAGSFAMAADLAAAQLLEQPLSAQMHYLHGLALVEIGDDAPALVALRRAAYLDPTAGFAQFLLAVVLGRLGHGAEASRAYGAAASSLSRSTPGEQVPELGGRRVEDLAQMCWRLASGSRTTAAPAEVSSR